MSFSKTIQGDLRTIGVVALGLIGDVFMRVPLVEAIGKAFPSARLVVVVDPPSEVVFKNHPAVSAVITHNRAEKNAVVKVRNSFDTVLKLRRLKLDVLIDMYNGGSSAFLTGFSGARYRIGYVHSSGLRIACNVPVLSPPRNKEHLTRRYAKLLSPIGIDPDNIHLGTSFYLEQQSLDFAEKHVPLTQCGYVAINLDASTKDKRWPLKNFAELARLIKNQYGFVPVVVTNPNREWLSEEFVKLFEGPCIRLPLTTLDNVGAAMSRCRCVITGDTSLMHVAFGLKIDTLGLFTYTRPEWVTPEDCIMVPCFIPDPNTLDNPLLPGVPMGKNSITVSHVFERFRKLLVTHDCVSSIDGEST